MNIRKLKEYFDAYVAGCKDLSGLIFAVNEANALAHLKGKEGVQLLVTYPSSEGAGAQNNGIQIHSILVMVLEPSNTSSQTGDEEFEQFARLRELIENVRQQIEDYSSESKAPWARLSLLGTRIEPEYNLTGWNGWACDVIF